MDNLNSLLPRVIRDLTLLTNELQKIDGVLNGGRHQSADVQTTSKTRSVKTGTEAHTPHSPSVIPGQYAGQRAIDALENYLRARKGLRVPLDRCVQDLIAGGAGTDKTAGRSSDPARRMTHNLKIAVPNRPETFCWEPVVASRKGLPAMPRRPGRKGPDVSVTVWLTTGASPHRNVNDSQPFGAP